MIKNLCNNCPDEIRGLCCFYNIIIEGHNVILRNQHCKYLDLETKKCKVYKERFKKQPNCLQRDKMYNTGCLPEGCLYLKDHPEREENPKIDIRKVINKISPKGIAEYNFWNNILNIEQFAIKNED